MNKFGKAVLALIIAVSLSLPCIIGFNYNNAFEDLSSEKYVSDLTSIYKEYDGSLESKDENDELALNRIIVADYNGKLYGCVKRAWDRKNKFAVLQYETREEAKKALKQIKSEGLTASGDGVAELIGDKCEVDADQPQASLRKSNPKGTFHPSGSEYVGTAQYIEKIGMNTDDIIVAIVDTGVMYDHPQIEDRFYSHGVDLSSDGAADAYYDTSKNGEYYGHATMVAGIVADNTPDNVKILPFKAVAFGATYATASSMISGINQAVTAGASVVSMSLSSSSSMSLFENAIDNAIEHGTLVCSSAGNSSKQISNSPANVDNNITVAALNGDSPADFTNFGRTVDFTAQGYKIRSTFPNIENGGFAKGTGTSFSTPYIAACCADIKSVNKNMSWQDVYDALLDFVVDRGDEGWDKYCGYGSPYLGNMIYTDNESYTFSIPEGTLSVTQSNDYTAETQPWRRFAPHMADVTVDESIEAIGDYAFCNMNDAVFHMKNTYNNIGAYAFYGCNSIKSFTFGIDVENVGYGAFQGIEGFVMNGYRNTPAEFNAIHDELSFNAIGCNHNYYYEVIDPTKTEAGYTLYTCSVCGDQYVGDYIEPVVLKTGKCGADMTFTVYDTGKLVIDGEGDMYNYLYSTSPWNNYSASITKLVIGKNVNNISPFGFYYCKNIKKISVDEDSAYYYQNDKCLIKKQDNALVLAIANGVYEIPEIVEKLSATAFVMNMPERIIPNASFTVSSDLVYDSNGNIVAALPSYNAGELTIDSNTIIKEYAFLFTESPDCIYCDWINADIENFGIGYYYNGTLNKRDVTFYTGSDTKFYDYATRKGFTVNTENCGKCGDGIIWRYNYDTSKLTLTGEGDMYTYTAKSQVPWSANLTSLKEVVIADGITYISPYSFYRASSLRKLTMPFSVRAFQNDKAFQGCTSIKTLKLTRGSGISDDYGEDETSLLYSYTPWYIARNSITDFSLDPNVKYIGKYMFRNCLAINNLSFNCVEEIADHAFVACTNLIDVTNYCKTTVYHDYSLFSYQFGSSDAGVYENRYLHAYCDSTSKDYCSSNGVINFVSLGCGHSRSTSYSREERACFGVNTLYYCGDCGEEYVYSYVSDGAEYDFTLNAENLKGLAVNGAEIMINSCVFGVTDENGIVSGKAVAGTYTLKLCVKSSVLYEGEIVIPESNSNAFLKFRYGNYNNDGAVNGKDYAISLRNNVGDKALFDHGKLAENESELTVQ